MKERKYERRINGNEGCEGREQEMLKFLRGRVRSH